jgi:NodT family efflux transporter outer membrane factor (OMF) lipoprotein
MSISAKNRLVALALLGALAGCAVGPDFERPAPPAVKGYAEGGDPRQTIAASGGVQAFDAAMALPASWWEQFDQPALTAMLREAAKNNPGLLAAQAALRASQNGLRAGYGVFFPQIEGGFGATRETSTPIRIGESLPSSLYNLFTLSGTVSYVLDIFGGERRTVEALGAAVDLQEAEARATWLTVATNIASTAIARAAYHAEIAATEELAAAQREQLRLAEIQFAAGIQPFSAVLALRNQLAITEAGLPGLRQKQDQTGTLLATLVGAAPAAWTPPDIALDSLTLPQRLPLSLPSDLVEQRPDIKAAEAVLHQASAAIGVATAALLPSVTLSGSYSANSTAMATLFNKSGQAWDIGAGVTTPIFEGGTLWYRRKEAIETYQQQAANYRQTVLAAYQQVADSLKAITHDAEAAEAEDRAVAASSETLHLLQANYDAGLVAYDQLLAGKISYLSARLAQIQALAARHQDSVALFAALGGGWWNEKLAEKGGTSEGR